MTPRELAVGTSKGLAFPRLYTTPRIHPYDQINWERRTASISNDKGEVIFEQKDVEVPDYWSMTATNVVVSKYFKSAVDRPGREQSARELIDRVALTIGKWGREGGYFASPADADTFEMELTHLLIHQKLAFNSPVWFNLGIVPKPQISACQPYHARVLTIHGPMAIGDIVEKRLIGLPIFDGEGITQVVAVKANGTKPVFKVELRDGFSVEVTGDHLVCAHDVRRTSRLEWRRVDQLEVGMVMRVYPHSAGTITRPGDPQEVSEAALAGWLQSDGYVGHSNPETERSLTIEFITNGDEEYNWVLKHLDTIFPEAHSHTRDVETKDANLKVRRIRLYGEHLRPFVEKYDLLKRGLDIRVPQAIFESSNDAGAAYLRSIFQAEGYAMVHGENSGHIALAVISPDWVRDMQVLLTRFGIYSRVRQKKEKREDRYDMHELDVSIRSERCQFARKIGFLDERKQSKLLESLERSGKECPDIRFSEIVSIRPVGDRDVYDVQTQSGQYLSEGVLVHNCFINSVDDDMESILTLACTEGMLFKWGSGTGTNLSTIRSSKERLSSGGWASGPVSFMRGYDAFAGVIRSGGKTRRAAKMVILNIDHPDIAEFIACKHVEEKKAWALIDAGYDGSFGGEAYNSIFFQNSNNSVRVTDEFMRAVEEDREWVTRSVTDGVPMDRYRAPELRNMIAESAHACGDPGLQYDTTINDWHTVPNSGRINATNPCVTGDTLVATSKGPVRIDRLLGENFEVVGSDGELHSVEPAFRTGTKPVYRLRTRSGFEVKLTGDHKVLTTNRGDVRAISLRPDDRIALSRSPVIGDRVMDWHVAEFLGLLAGKGELTQDKVSVDLPVDSGDTDAFGLCVLEGLRVYHNEWGGESPAESAVRLLESADGIRIEVKSAAILSELRSFFHANSQTGEWTFTDEVYRLGVNSLRGILRGLFASSRFGVLDLSGEEIGGIKLDSTSLARQVQLLLLAMGIKVEARDDRLQFGSLENATIFRDETAKNGRPFVGASSKYQQLEGRLDEARWVQRGWSNASETATLETLDDAFACLEFLGEEMVYDLTEPATSHFAANGIVVHNCGEYIHIDDSACNLASLNLRKFQRDDGSFDVESFKHAVRISITAQEILVGNASYPTKKISENSPAFRPLGLGYANLGALLMSRGMPYDSEKGRAFAGAITALMTGHAYRTSAELAATLGPFARFEENRQPMLRVMRKHQAAVEDVDASLAPTDVLDEARDAWARAIRAGEQYGYRNSQTTVLAPTGTIGFMLDCDTMGVEPDIALVKYKKMVGGGLLKLVNLTMPEALRTLCYSPDEITEITEYVEDSGTIEGAPGLKDEHLPVFDCAFKPTGGIRTIHYMGHIGMVAAVQPFLSGGVSKTINMPNETTIEEIGEAYMAGWRKGLKALALYRDGCKRAQPLNTSLETKEDESGKKDNGKPAAAQALRPVRTRLPDERRSITHKFSVGGHEGYLTVGMYEDGRAGEIFVTMAKEGSVVSGLMDCVATATSISLQYGVPLKVLVNKFSHTRFEPAGFTNNKQIPIAKSVMDYIFRWLALKFLAPAERPHDAVSAGKGAALVPEMPTETESGGNGHTTRRAIEIREREIFDAHADSPPCPECGSIMVRNGACYQCLNCGSTSGCG